MPHIVFVPFTGFRVREDEMRELGMSLPGFKQRAAAIAELPALGQLTLAGTLPESWTCSYYGAPSANEGVIERILAEQPNLVTVSALTASNEVPIQSMSPGGPSSHDLPARLAPGIVVA